MKNRKEIKNKPINHEITIIKEKEILPTSSIQRSR